MVKFLHTGDLHLGLKFQNMNFNSDDSHNRRMDLWETLERMIDYSIEKELDFMFLSGDLYEDKYFTLGDVKKLRDLLAKAKGVNILIVAGNHDYRHKNSLYNKVEWSENVHIFGSEGIEEKIYEDLDTIIYGYSWSRVSIDNGNVLDGVDFSSGYKNKILMIHGDVYTDSNYLPLKIEKLKSLDLDYVALGHIHKPEIFENKIAYPGCPEPLHFGEVGKRGFIEGALDSFGLKLDFIDFSKREFVVEKIRVEETMSALEIVELFNRVDESSRLKDYYRIIVDGYIQNDMDKRELLSMIEKNFYYIEIVDKTIPDYDLDRLEMNHENDIIGSFIKEMKEKDLSIKLNKDALYYGLEVLLKERI